MFDEFTAQPPTGDQPLGADPTYPGITVYPDSGGDGFSLVVHPEDPVDLPPADLTLMPPAADVTMAEVLDHLDAAQLNNPALTPDGYTAQYQPDTGTVEDVEEGYMTPSTPIWEE
jgi:hypothetical protein